MKQRGRPPAAAIEMIPRASVLDRVERQRAPHDLTDEEVEIWTAVVSSEPADWFSPATVPLLVQYCRHCVRARHVGELIERRDPNLTLQDYDRLLKMQERESRTITMLATKMRLCQTSTINQRGNKKLNLSKVWDG